MQLRRSSALALSLVLPLALLGGCGGSSSGSKATASASPSGSAASSGSPSPVPTSHDAALLPSVAGGYGTKPTLDFGSKKAPSALVSTVVKEGGGKTVQKGDLLVADYLGQVWGGKVFDNSYDRSAPAGFGIGVGQVIPGWDKVLVGVKAGSRVVMSIPPSEGYGSSGNEQAGIKGTDTLVFVVDIVSSYDKTAAAQADAAPADPAPAGITVSGPLGAAPTLAVAAGTTAPTAPAEVTLAKGTGAPVAPGLVVLQYVATGYDGKPAGSSWQDGTPVGVTVTGQSSGSPFEKLIGVPVGSRVLVSVPASGSQAAVAVVADIVAQPTSAKG